MAYTRHNWTCGEDITAELLNNLEDGVEEAQNGYECTETKSVLADETVTTVMDGDAAAAELASQTPIVADKIIVTLNDTEYQCQNLGDSEQSYYGAPYDETIGAKDWSEYPFYLTSDSDGYSELWTQTAGTYTLKVESVSSTIDITDCFYKAVKKAVEEMNTIWIDVTGEAQPCTGSTGCFGAFYLQISKSEAEVYASAGKIIKVHDKRSIVDACSGQFESLEGVVAVYNADTNIFEIGSKNWSYIESEDKYYYSEQCPY